GSLEPERLEMQLVYLKLVMIGLVIVVSLLLSERGLLPEVPKRPDDPRPNHEPDFERRTE
ncbi:MAG TPA: hypothetical protein DDW46_09905, partial [Dehalococcoidia bacterium]|nr:hypothetical protein [Dehalococcoidia bacterium]